LVFTPLLFALASSLSHLHWASLAAYHVSSPSPILYRALDYIPCPSHIHFDQG
jgi:hypothetical protein